MLGTIDQFYGFALVKLINQWVGLEGVRERRQASCREGRSTLLILHALIEQVVDVSIFGLLIAKHFGHNSM